MSARSHSDVVFQVSPDFEDRRQHAWNKLRDCLPPERIRGRLLDIACGTGNGVVAGLQLGFDLAVGIDRSFGEFVWFRVEDFDAICEAYGVNAAQGLLVEGDVFETSFPRQSFDCVMLLDAIEHVPEPRRFIELAASYVAPGGYLIIDTSPLYFSKLGHHLWGYFPPEKYPWVHLRHDFEELASSAGVDSWSMERFRELNQITHSEVRDFVEGTGLQLEMEHRDTPDTESMAALNALKGELALDGIPYHELFESWILLVARRS